MRLIFSRLLLVMSILPVAACTDGGSIASSAGAAGVDPTSAIEVAVAAEVGVLNRLIQVSSEGDEPVSPTLDSLIEKASQGDAESQRLLANEYLGRGLAGRDIDAARELYDLAADQGDAKAQHNLGVMYFGGVGVEQDYKLARDWYMKAADQGLMESQYNLAMIYYSGDGVEVDRSIAGDWFREACESGSEDGCYGYERVSGNTIGDDAGAVHAEN